MIVAWQAENCQSRIVRMPGPNRRARLRRGSTIEIDHFRADDDDARFKVPKFQPLSSRYKKLEDKRIKEEEKAKLKKPKKQDSEDLESQENAEEVKERERKKAELERVQKIYFHIS